MTDLELGRVEERGAPDFEHFASIQGRGALGAHEFPGKVGKAYTCVSPGEGMRQLPESERPREKLIAKGPQSLSDAELLALLISSGSKNASALQIARKMLDHLGGVQALGQSQFDDLVEMAGIGDAKATTIVAAFELARRHQSAAKLRSFFSCPSQIAEYLRPHLSHQPHEVFRVLLLNKANSLVGEKDLFRGGISSTCVDPLIVFRYAIQHRASKLILSHNHPSGDCHPSQCDYDITDRIVRIGHTMGVRVVDHVIVSNWGYYSFSEEGLINDILADHQEVEKKASLNRRHNLDAINGRRAFGGKA